MTSCRDVIKNAYRKAAILGVGQSMSSSQADIGLDTLKDTYMSLVNNGTLGTLRDIYADADITAKEFSRVTRATDTVTVTWPDVITDECTNKPRAPIDGSVIVQVGPSGSDAVYKVYDAATASWESLSGLTLTSNAPMTSSFKQDIEALLGVALADAFGIPIAPLLAQQFKTARYHLARRGSTAPDTQKVQYF